ncbi:MAG: hypothetical protein MUQ10_05030, partial [Anaerolineae bacterium]|nr:hypothetical protein [Anaerolineae bacterium]
VVATVLVAVVTLALPYTPIAPRLGLEPLSLPLLAALLSITLLYLVTSEIVKHFFYKRQRAL